jgi:hypothetical protein
MQALETRRKFLVNSIVLPVASLHTLVPGTAAGQASRLDSARFDSPNITNQVNRLSSLGRAFQSAQFHYRGVHFGTHRPVYYEMIRRVNADVVDGKLQWRESVSEIHDGDVFEGPNRLPRARRFNLIDPTAMVALEERMDVEGKQVGWEFKFNRIRGRVSGNQRRRSDAIAFAGDVDQNSYSVDTLNLILASLPLAVGYERSLNLIQPIEGGGISLNPVEIKVSRQQFVRLGEAEIPVLRVEVTSTKPHLPGTGVRLVLSSSPHWLIRSEYQSTHVNGPPVFDSQGADVLTAVVGI